MNDTPYRYTAALAAAASSCAGRTGGRARARSTPPTRPARWADPERVAGRREALRPGHVPLPVRCRAARRAPAGLHRHRRLRPLPADDRQQRAARHGLRRLRPARRAVRRADRPAPARAPPRTTSTTMQRQLRRLGLGHDERRSFATIDDGLLPLDAVDLPADLQLLVRRAADGGRGRARPISELEALLRVGRRAPTPDGRPGPSCRQAERRAVVDGDRLAYISEAPVNWCPGLGTVLANEEVTADGRCERGNFPVFRRSLTPVDDADHRVRRPAGRRPGPAGLARAGQADAAQLDRPLARRQGALPRAAGRRRRGPGRGLHHPPRHPVRRDVHGAGPRAPAGRRDGAAATGRRARATAWTGGARDPGRGRRGVPAGGRRASPRWSGRAEGKDKTGVFTGAFATNPVNGAQIPVFVADYVLMGYGTGAIMAVPGQDERDWEFAATFDLPIVRTVQPPAGHPEGEAFTGDGPAINSANDEISLDGLDVAEAKATIIDWLAGQGLRRADDHLPAARLAVLPAALLGRAVPDRLRRGRRRRSRCPSRCCRSSCRRSPTTRRKTFDPDDATPTPEPPLSRATEWVEVELDLGDGPKRYRRETNTMPQLGRLVLVRAALPGPGQRRARSSTRRSSATGWARRTSDAAGATTRRRRPVRRRRRARRAAPAVRPVLAQGAVRPGPRLERGAVPPAVQPGLHPGLRLHRRPRPATCRPTRSSRPATRRRRRPGRGTTSRSTASTARWASR